MGMSSSTAMSMSMGAQAVGGAASAYGAYSAAQSKKDMLGIDSQIAGWQASQAIQSGQQQEFSSRLQEGAMFGRQRANMAANGVQLGSGSALDVLAGTKLMGNVDAATIHDNALRAAWGYQTQATIDKSASQNINPMMSGLTTLLGSAGSVANSWYRYNTASSGIGG